MGESRLVPEQMWEAGSLWLSMAALPVVNFALVHNSVSVIQHIEVSNAGPDPVENVVLRASLQGLECNGTVEWSQVIPVLESGHSRNWEMLEELVPPRAHLRELVEAYDASIRCSVSPGLTAEPMVFDVPLRVLAFNEWIFTPACVESLSSFVQPNNPAVGTILATASSMLAEQTGDGSLQGYQAGPGRAGLIAAALYSALADFGVRYVNPPASFEETGQKVRTSEQVLGDRVGTCIDLSVTYAACLEAAGLHPQIWIVEGHAFVGFWRDEVESSSPVIRDPNTMINLAMSGNVIVAEAKFYAPSSAPTFTDAVAEAKGQLTNPDRLRCVVDVAASRRARVTPFATTASTQKDYADHTPQAATVVAAPRPDLTLPDELTARRDSDQVLDTTDPAPARVKRWKRALLDLSTRNRLLNLRASREVIYLTLPDQALATAQDRWHSGKRINLRAEDDFDGVRQLSGVRTSDDLSAVEINALLLGRQEAYAKLPSDRYKSTLRHLQRTARTLLEETGSANLYLTFGSLVHRASSGRDAHAPLFLLPARLVGGEGNSSFSVVADESSVAAPNHCLVEWLRVAHGVAFESLSSPPIDDNGLDITLALAQIRTELVAYNLPFRVAESSTVAICKFGTFGMWSDLQRHWESLETSPLVRHLTHNAGDTFIDPRATDDRALNSVEVNETDHPLPAPYDGSQLRAVELSAQGRTFVLEGPPGTGKSQTITNMIARNLDAGRTVLFVAEKQAALDVVRTRLDAAGLGPFVLDLHSAAGNGKAIRNQLRESFDVRPEYNPRVFETDLIRWRTKHLALEDYPERVHGRNSIGDSLWSAAEVLAAQPDDQGFVELPTHFVANATPDQTDAIREAIVAFSRQAIPSEIRARNPWTIAGAPADDETILAAHACAGAALERVDNDPESARILASLPTPDDALALVAQARAEAGRRTPDSARLAQLTDTRWLARVTEAIERLRDFQTNSNHLIATFHDEFLNNGAALELTETIRAAGHGFFGKRKRMESAESSLRRTLRPSVELEITAAVSLLDQLPGFRSARGEYADLFSHLFGDQLPVGWTPVSPTAEHEIREVLQYIESTARFAADQPRTWVTLRGLNSISVSTLDTVTEAVEVWRGWLRAVGADKLSLRRWVGDGNWFARWAGTQAEWSAELDEFGPGVIRRYVALDALLAPLRANGLDEFAAGLLAGDVPREDAELRYLAGVARASTVERITTSGLIDFAYQVQDGRVTDFSDASIRMRDRLAQSLPAKLAAQRPFDPDALEGTFGKLRRALDGNRNLESVRTLMIKYGAEIAAVTPCFLVSPSSLAQFVPPGEVTFDLVVFDEASQITVAQAIGALGRARSAVIVGDSKQMPPTAIGLTNTDIDDPDDESSAVPDDLDSILSESVESGIPRLWLSWHYRSKDESLIAFSNEKYYESRLASLPSPGHSADSGVELRRVGGHFNREDRKHEYRTNRREAEAIVSEIRRLVNAEYPQRSIGVVTFNRQQQDLVLDLLTECGDRTIAQLLQPSCDNGLFVKNLENVQGDERDVVLFSTAFSKPKGATQLPLNFGPLTRSGGERRLNVAVTRARRKVVVFTSFEPSDIDLSRTRSVGMAHLRRYLEAADSRLTTTSAPDSNASNGALQDQIAAKLRAAELEVRQNYGMSEFKVDLAVRVVGSPEWQIAVMLDGPQWQKRATVTDRDIMPGLLESLMEWPGVIRVWLPDWLQHQDEIVGRIRLAAENAEFDRLAAMVADEPVDAEEPVASGGEQPSPPALPTVESASGIPIRSLRTVPVIPGSDCEEAVAVRMTEPQVSARVSLTKKDSDLQLTLIPETASGPAARPDTSFVPDHQPIAAARQPRDSYPLEYVPCPDTSIGERHELDDTTSRSVQDKVRRALVQAVETEGPIEFSRLCGIVVRRFEWDRATKPRRAFVAELVPEAWVRRDETLGDFAWPEDLDPADWRAFRRSNSKERPISEICPEEIINALCYVIDQCAADAEQLFRDTLSQFGQGRLTSTAQERLSACLNLAILEGRLAQRGRLYHIPSSTS